MSKRSWYSIEAKAGSKEADLFIFDDIGIWGITAQEFVKDLNGITAEQINLKLKSRGGDVFDGIAIHNSLKSHSAKIVVTVESLAASIATIIALAGDEVYMAEHSFWMIHNARSGVMGEAKEMRKMADVLDKISEPLINIYTERTGKAEAEIKTLMDDETWYSAEEAVDAGFVDAVTKTEAVEASFDLSIYNNVPINILNTLSGGKPSPRRLEHALREVGGLSNSDAKAVVAKGYKVLDHREDEPGGSQREVDITIKNKTTGGKVMTRDELKAQFPDIFNAIIAEGQKGLLSEDVIAARVEEAVKAENERVLSLDKLSADMPGHEAMIAKFKEDKTITAENAALQIVAAHGEKLKGIRAQQKSDAVDLDNVPGADGGLGADGAKGFMALVSDHQTDHKCSKGAAIKAIARSHKAEHAAYIKQQNKEVRDV